jgi:hypothetical protein
MVTVIPNGRLVATIIGRATATVLVSSRCKETDKLLRLLDCFEIARVCSLSSYLDTCESSRLQSILTILSANPCTATFNVRLVDLQCQHFSPCSGALANA